MDFPPTDDHGQNGKSYEDAAAAFWEVASEVLERDVPRLPGDTPIADLGIESLPMFEVIGGVERRLKIRLADEELSSLRTVDDLLRTVGRHLTPS